MQQGYIRLYRSILDKGWSRLPDYVAVWVYCLMRANYHEGEYCTKGGRVIKLQPGQFITGRQQMAVQTGVNEYKIERILKCFENEQQITQQTFSKFRVISILNWDKYQARAQENEQQLHNKRTTDAQHLHTSKEGKEVNNKNPSSSGDEGEEFYLTKNKKKLVGKRLEAFNEFWEAFNYKSGKAEAADAWLGIPLLTDAIVAKIVTAAKAEAQRRPEIKAVGKTPKMAQGWLSGRRWEDEQGGGVKPAQQPYDESESIAIRKALAKYEY